MDWIIIAVVLAPWVILGLAYLWAKIVVHSVRG